MKSAKSLLKECAKIALKSALTQKALPWMQDNVIIGADAREPGPFKLSPKYTYFREIYETLDDPAVREFVLMKIPQIGGSTFMLNFVQWLSCTGNGKHGLWVTSTADVATELIKREVVPRIESCPTFKGLLKKGMDSVTAMKVELVRGNVYFAGGQSPNGIAGTPCEWVCVDESDKIQKATAREAHAGDLAKKRVSQFEFTSRMLYVSTPTEEKGYIHMKYLEGSQGVYMMKCPHCGHFQELTFTQDKKELRCDDAKRPDGKYDLDKVRREAYYVCQVSGCRIEQHSKLEMIVGGYWHHKNPNSTIKSWHLSGFLAPFFSWGEILARFLVKCHEPGGLQDFFNGTIGLPNTPPKCEVSDAEIAALAARSAAAGYSYNRGALPFRPAYIAMTVDTQGATTDSPFWYTVFAIDKNHNMAIVEWGHVSTFSDLLHVAQTPRVFGDESFACMEVLQDYAGTRSDDVLDFVIDARKVGLKVTPCMGRTRRHNLYEPIKYTTVTAREVYKVSLLFFRDDSFKDELYYRRIKEGAGPGFYIPQDYALRDRDLVEQLMDERRVEVDGEMSWTDKGNNHLGDCCKQALVLAYVMSTEIERYRLELELIEATDKANSTPAAA